ncbi:MAG TPA: TetR/AcrR family transcriptional regulator [Clostridia bacterium]|nr:TetR/AcrR family transcriptional regulator [Clostridiaceae bacterium]HOA30427.1 TetR/AcrR family transcriptional regulator [Clostridia bacterium]HPZ52644.1 TetR/AcrR family transcriptional regulator [Clostridia bacterium]
MDKFLKLNPEKKKRILEAAYNEFSRNTYDNASTNRIVKEAGIGKGMLFFYFNSKKDLYIYLVEEGIEYIKREYVDKIDENETDFLEKWKIISRVKFEAYKKRPYIFNFMANVYLNSDMEGLPENLKRRIKEISGVGYGKLFRNIDTSLFRSDFTEEKVIRYIKLMISGYEMELTERLKGTNFNEMDVQPLWDEFYEYIDDLKTIFYK